MLVKYAINQLKIYAAKYSWAELDSEFSTDFKTLAPTVRYLPAPQDDVTDVYRRAEKDVSAMRM